MRPTTGDPRLCGEVRRKQLMASLFATSIRQQRTWHQVIGLAAA